MYKYEVKADKARTWIRLSVSTKAPLSDFDMDLYAENYAIDHQINPHTVAIRCIDASGNVVKERLSYAVINKGDTHA